jgi:endoglucanase
LAGLSEACGLGYVTEAAELVAGEARKYTDEVEIDQSGSVVAVRRGKGGGNVMLAAHLDEVGFFVAGIEEGYLRLSSVGGVDPRVLLGQEVIVYGADKLPGCIAVTAPHFTTPQERERVPAVGDLFVDLGLPEARVKRSVKIGSAVVVASRYAKLSGQFRRGRAFDNRAGIAAGLCVLKQLSQLNKGGTLYFVATTQEEGIGLGARINAYRHDIDSALAVDVAFGDHPELKEYEAFPLNQGPVISRGPSLAPKVFEALCAAARRLEIPFQVECLSSTTGTDADHMAFVKEGIPTGLISIPIRSMHSPVEIVCLKDIERTVRLIVNYLSNL